MNGPLWKTRFPYADKDYHTSEIGNNYIHSNARHKLWKENICLTVTQSLTDLNPSIRFRWGSQFITVYKLKHFWRLVVIIINHMVSSSFYCWKQNEISMINCSVKSSRFLKFINFHHNMHVFFLIMNDAFKCIFISIYSFRHR